MSSLLFPSFNKQIPKGRTLCTFGIHEINEQDLFILDNPESLISERIIDSYLEYMQQTKKNGHFIIKDSLFIDKKKGKDMYEVRDKTVIFQTKYCLIPFMPHEDHWALIFISKEFDVSTQKTVFYVYSIDSLTNRGLPAYIENALNEWLVSERASVVYICVETPPQESCECGLNVLKNAYNLYISYLDSINLIDTDTMKKIEQGTGNDSIKLEDLLRLGSEFTEFPKNVPWIRSQVRQFILKASLGLIQYKKPTYDNLGYESDVLSTRLDSDTSYSSIDIGKALVSTKRKDSTMSVDFFGENLSPAMDLSGGLTLEEEEENVPLLSSSIPIPMTSTTMASSMWKKRVSEVIPAQVPESSSTFTFEDVTKIVSKHDLETLRTMMDTNPSLFTKDVIGKLVCSTVPNYMSYDTLSSSFTDDDYPIFVLLINKGGDCNAMCEMANPSSSTLVKVPLLYKAIQNNNLQKVEYLVSECPSINVEQENDRKETPIFALLKYSDKGNDDNMLEMYGILETKVDVNAQDIDGNTILHRAIQEQYIDLIQLLLDNDKINLRIKNKNNETPLLLSTDVGHALNDISITIINMLTEIDDLIVRDNKGNTPLIYALQRQNYDVVNLLLEKNADLNDPNILQELIDSGLEKSRIFQTTQMVDLIKSRVAEKSRTETFVPEPDNTAVLVGEEINKIISKGDLYDNEKKTMIRKLLKEKPNANFNVQDSKGYTPLMNAINDRSLDLVTFILSQEDIEININLKNDKRHGYTALHWAIKYMDVPILMLLLRSRKHKFDINLVDDNGDNAFSLFLKDDDLETDSENYQGVYDYLLSRKDLNVNNKNKDSEYPIHYIVSLNNDAWIGSLIEKKKKTIDLNVRDNENRTPLMIAAQNENEGICALLIKNGANKISKTNAHDMEFITRNSIPTNIQEIILEP